MNVSVSFKASEGSNYNGRLIIESVFVFTFVIMDIASLAYALQVRYCAIVRR